MAYVLYLFPVETINNHRAPKYLKGRMNLNGIDVKRNAMDYGLMPVCIVAADVTPALHAEIVAHSDVRAIVEYANIDQPIGNAANGVRNVLEALSIPGTWVQSTDTWRQVLRGTMGLFQFAQRVHARFNTTLLPEGYTLDTTWSELPQGAKTLLLEAAAELGIDTSAATGQTKLRAIFRVLGDAWGDKVFYLGEVEV